MKSPHAFPPLVALAVRGIEGLIESMGKVLLGSIYQVAGTIFLIALAAAAVYFVVRFIRRRLSP